MDKRIVNSLLYLCARIDQHPEQYTKLSKQCSLFTSWDELLSLAETHGMSPLLYHHLCTIQHDYPVEFIRKLRFLTLHHKQANTILGQSLKTMLDIFEKNGIESLVLKGAALCHTLYPDIGLRPMRDIDILLQTKDAENAHKILQAEGFKTSRAIIPEDHFHSTPLYYEVDGYSICIELHHSLYAHCPPYTHETDFTTLYAQSISFICNGVAAKTLSDEDMLWHLYQHGFHAPLTYEPYKIISVADIVSLVEKTFDRLDWDRINAVFPQLTSALPLFHHLTPWNHEVVDILKIKTSKKISGIGKTFTGWPQKKLSETKGKSLPAILHKTFFPPQWWFMMYYSPSGRGQYWQNRIIGHPLHILWWARLYWAIFIKETSWKDDKKQTFQSRLLQKAHLIKSMWNKLR